MNKTKQSGFTLIELMIVVVIVAILMGIALPSYRNYVLRSHRADGQFGLTQCAAIQERWFTKNNQYNTNADACAATSPEGYYDIVIDIGDMGATGCGLSGTTNNDCFELSATPTNKAGQDSDTICATMTVDSMNLKTAKDSSNNNTKTDCWK